MKRKKMILAAIKLTISIILTVIAVGLYITGADTESFIAYSFLFNAFVVADIISEIAKRKKRRKRKMPQILINNNGIDLEEIERMQNEKDGNSIQEKPCSKNLKNRKDSLNQEKQPKMKEIKRIPTQKTKRTAIFTAIKLALTVLFLILNISVMVTKGENLLLLISFILVTLACIALQIIEHIREIRSCKL